ncbi:MAG: lysozyme [Clostridia bacterium]|nr:lysozyme [Clostridia bacterium]
MKNLKLLMINLVLIMLFNSLPNMKIELKEDMVPTSMSVDKQITSRSGKLRIEQLDTYVNCTEQLEVQTTTEMSELATTYSENCINLIKKYEGFRENAYKLEGEKNWTIGYGHSGTDVKEGQTITEEAAERLLIADVQGACDYILTKVEHLQLTQNELDALVSFTYNCGIGNFNKLTKDRNKEEIVEHIEAYNNGGMKGLVKRRTEEKELFLGGTKNEEI